MGSESFDIEIDFTTFAFVTRIEPLTSHMSILDSATFGERAKMQEISSAVGILFTMSSGRIVETPDKTSNWR